MDRRKAIEIARLASEGPPQKPCRVAVCTVCRNERELIPFYLRHYERIAGVIYVWDDDSDDGSFDLLKQHPKVHVNHWPFDTGIDEEKNLAFAYTTLPQLRGCADWVIWCDIDEFIWAHDLALILRMAHNEGYGLIRAAGFNMVGNGLPPDDGYTPLTCLLRRGVSSPTYSKPIIIQPDVQVRWSRGKHGVEWCSTNILFGGPLLLHYRYLGYEYTKARNARNYGRVGLKNGDKGAAWTCAPDYEGEHSALWAARIEREAVEVIPPCGGVS